MADKIIDINLYQNSPRLALKQDKKDDTLITQNKTIVGAINENNDNIEKAIKIVENKQDKLYSGTYVSIVKHPGDTPKIDITEQNMDSIADELFKNTIYEHLKTNKKTPISAINEVKSPWEEVGTWQGRQKWNFIPVSGRYYRVKYNLSHNASVEIQKVFRWSGASADTPVVLDQHIVIDEHKSLTVISLVVTPDSVIIDSSTKPLPADLGDIMKLEKCVWDDF